MNFLNFKAVVAKQFAEMAKGELFVTDTSSDEIYEIYLKSYPEGSNPIFRERTEHDCSCCKQFIRTVGNVVAIVNGKLVSIWDVKIKGEPEYQAVADAMANYVKSKEIYNPFFHYETFAGTDKSLELIDGKSHQWNHFYVTIPSKFLKRKWELDTVRGAMRTDKDVFTRSLDTISMDAVETVSELIATNSLYRGAEHAATVDGFLKLKKNYDKLNVNEKKLFVWDTVTKSNFISVIRIRNTAIGTLLVDVSEGVDIEKAVASFESKVAPANYKRTSSVVTPKMVEQAKAKINELGLASALPRRYAALTDIAINDILFADRTAKATIEGDDSVFDTITSTAVDVKKLSRVDSISIIDFVEKVLPTASSVSVLVENKHKNNLVSLVAPVDPTANKLFKWNNNFSWSYNGDFTDSIKERVKAAGGNVTGEFCCRLSWDNTTDLDFHMHEPNQHEIYYDNRGNKSPNGGMLDIDANGLNGMWDDPVENIFYNEINTMKPGVYKLVVDPFSIRSRANEGFTVQVEINGEIMEYHSDKFPSNNVIVGEFEKKKDGTLVVKSFKGDAVTSSKKLWNIDTQNFHRCNVIMNSPNHWGDSGTGNKHYFFMLQDCVNDGSARGFYNEFLSNELTPNRKVLEIVGGKMRTQETPDQLSGLGFSDTMRNEVIVKVTGKTERVFKVQF